MDRRNFIKASLCLGCAAAIGYGYFSSLNNLKQKPEDKLLYKKESELPTKVRLEACNDCQLNCAKCWMRQIPPEVMNKVGGFGYLKFKDFKNFVDKHPFIKEIELSNNGEIFLNPELNDIIKYAYEKNIKLCALNGVNLNTVSEETLENLVKYKFAKMSVSIDGATPEVYKIYRRGGDFNTVIANIKKINEFKEKYNSSEPELYWQFIVFGHNEHEIDAAKEYAEKLNMEIVYDKNIAEDYSPIKDVKMVEEKTGLRYPEYANRNDNENEAISSSLIAQEDDTSGVDSDDNEETNNAADISRDSILCYQLVEQPQINFNGDLLGCCALAEENFGVNVFKKRLLEALNSDKFLRAKLMLSDLNVEPFDDIPCSRCSIYLDLIKKNNCPLSIPQYS